MVEALINGIALFDFIHYAMYKPGTVTSSKESFMLAKAICVTCEGGDAILLLIAHP